MIALNLPHSRPDYPSRRIRPRGAGTIITRIGGGHLPGTQRCLRRQSLFLALSHSLQHSSPTRDPHPAVLPGRPTDLGKSPVSMAKWPPSLSCRADMVDAPGWTRPGRAGYDSRLMMQKNGPASRRSAGAYRAGNPSGAPIRTGAGARRRRDGPITHPRRLNHTIAQCAERDERSVG